MHSLSTNHDLSFLLLYNLDSDLISNLMSASTFCSLSGQRQAALDKHHGTVVECAYYGTRILEDGKSGRGVLGPG